MNVSFEPAFRYSNLFWALPNKHVYFAAGYNCQLIMVFPELDIVAVTTARDNCPHGRLADAISRAVKSETAPSADAAAAHLLADAIRNSSTEKRSEVGATPELASAISGKIYTFPANALNLKSLSLTFAEPEAQYDLEVHRQDPGQALLASSGQIGLDGLYRKGEPSASGTVAMKGTWLNGSTFVIERLIIGAGQEAQKWTLSYDGPRLLHLRGRARDGRTVIIDGESGG
jgi:hypothetical protein